MVLLESQVQHDGEAWGCQFGWTCLLAVSDDWTPSVLQNAKAGCRPAAELLHLRYVKNAQEDK